MACDEQAEKADSARPRRSGWERLGWWVLRGTVLLILLLAALAMPLACTTRVVPPQVIGEGVDVMLVDLGRTPSLVLPRSQGGYDRWVYGEFRWYALGRTGFYRAPAVLFWPTQGGLGREHFETDDLGAIARIVGGEAHFVITVSAPDAYRLQAELEALFDMHRATQVRQVDGPMDFVHHPQSYTYFFNSNHMVARWLRELGCRTYGPAFVSRWRVDHPPDAAQ